MSVNDRCKIDGLLGIINLYQVDLLSIEEVNGDYIIEKGSNRELFCGSLCGCIDFLEDYKIRCYEHTTRLWGNGVLYK